jgi:hypothetical protein
LVDNGAVVSVREHAGVEAAMVAPFLRLSVERARERGQGASEGECGVVVSMKASRLTSGAPAGVRSPPRVHASTRACGRSATDGSEL